MATMTPDYQEKALEAYEKISYEMTSQEHKERSIALMALLAKQAYNDGLERGAEICEERVDGQYRYGNREAEQCAIAIRKEIKP